MDLGRWAAEDYKIEDAEPEDEKEDGEAKAESPLRQRREY